ncbi:uncharacterized protein METZ01_LOCUS15294 [marine metagenome]|uniref:Uncharacterized protein n=1 Tax=marine metagenome TaxID=408172 RepID=A0A381P6F6_9ZZZZ
MIGPIERIVYLHFTDETELTGM